MGDFRVAQEVADGLTRRELLACTITLKVRYSDFTTVTRAHTSMVPTARAGRIAAIATGLLRRTDAGRRSVRLLGVSVSTLVPATMQQLELFEQY